METAFLIVSLHPIGRPGLSPQFGMRLLVKVFTGGMPVIALRSFNPFSSFSVLLPAPMLSVTLATFSWRMTFRLACFWATRPCSLSACFEFIAILYSATACLFLLRKQISWLLQQQYLLSLL